MNYKYSRLAGFSMLVLLSININSQESNDTIINYNEVVILNPPSENFIPIVLQTYKNEIRLGQQNNYSLKKDGTYVSHHVQPTLAKEIDEKETQLQYSREALYELLKLKFMDDVYADMDIELLTKYNSTMYLKDKNSYNAQQHLFKLANAIHSVEKIYEYFCNPKLQDCTLSDTNNVYYYKNCLG